jgi:hypothetical protein
MPKGNFVFAIQGPADNFVMLGRQQLKQGQGQLQGQELYRLTRVAFSELRQVRGGSREFNKSSKVVRAWFRVLQLSQLPQADWERVRTRLAFNPFRQA